jgi:hypothetical protein
VPETYSFWDLHVAIQNAMGWIDAHLHEFEMRNPKSYQIDTIGIVTEEDDLYTRYMRDGCKKKIARYFSEENRKAHYRYDFGDGWEHDIVLEKILPTVAGQKYPQILGGARLCPPEDCGGPPGYERLVMIMQNPKNPEYRKMLAWYGHHYDPDSWSPTQVHFVDPKLHYQQVFVDDIEPKQP